MGCVASLTYLDRCDRDCDICDYWDGKDDEEEYRGDITIELVEKGTMKEMLERGQKRLDEAEADFIRWIEEQKEKARRKYIKP